MALKLPKRSVAVASDTDEGKLSENLNPATLIDLESAQSGFAPLTDDLKTPAKNAEHDANLTFIGDVLEHGRDIKLPLIGHLSLQRQIRVLFVSMFVLLALGGTFVYLNSSQKYLASIQNQIAGDALMHSQRIGKAAPNAIQGKPEAFKCFDQGR
jgi:twitching motility protein PilJ